MYFHCGPANLVEPTNATKPSTDCAHAHAMERRCVYSSGISHLESRAAAASVLADCSQLMVKIFRMRGKHMAYQKPPCFCGSARTAQFNDEIVGCKSVPT